MKQFFNAWWMDLFSSIHQSLLQLKYEDNVGACDIQLDNKAYQQEENKIYLVKDNFTVLDQQ